MKRVIMAGAFIFFIAWVRSLILTGVSNDTLFLFMFFAACAVYGAGYQRLVRLRWLNLSLLTAAVFFLCLSIFLAAYGMRDTVTYTEDAVIVLGCGLNGEEPSRTLRHRLDKAAEYHDKNPNAQIFVCGGQGKNETIPEAVVMERFLITQRGVDPAKITREEESSSTYENINFVLPLVRDFFNGQDFTVAVITSDFHVYRGAWFAQAHGINATRLHAASAWYLLPVNYARECAAVLKMWILKI